MFVTSRWVSAVNVSKTKFWAIISLSLGCFLFSCFVNFQSCQRAQVFAFGKFCIDEHDIFDAVSVVRQT